MDTVLGQTHAGRLWAVVAALAAGLVVAAAIGRSETQTQGVEECPNHGSHADTFTLPGQITNIPEFHDCQRFMIDGRTYDSVYAIFARFRLDTVTFPSRVQCYREVPGGPVRVDSTSRLRVARTGIALLDTTGRGLVDPDGRVRVDSTGTRLLNPDSSVRGQIVHCREIPGLTVTRIGVPVALIQTRGGRYRPLGIDVTFNCLYLSHQSPSGWSAKMVPVRGEGDCLPREVNFDRLSGTVLTVFPRVGLGFRKEDYPPVARWDRDPRHGLYYVGVMCGGAWCEVGATRTEEVHAVPSMITAPSPVLVSSRNFRVGVGLPLNEAQRTHRRVYEIKGWYDEQYLAVPTAAGLRPSSILGTVFPDAGLDARTLRAYTAQWIAAAHVVISEPSQHLKTKLNLEAGSVPDTMNTVYLCSGSVEQCIPVDSRATMNARCRGATDNMDPASRARWWARIVAVSGQVAYKCVKRTAHPGMRMPGTARWSWDKTRYDDPIWVDCEEGCCKVS